MTKALSVGERKRRKKLSISAPHREKNGRKQRDPNRADKVRKVAVEARMKQHGLTEAQAKNPDAESFIGRAYLLRQASLEQKNTAEWFATALLQYRNAIQSPGRSKGKAGMAEPESEEYQRYCDDAKRRFDGIVAVLREHDIANRGRTNSLGTLEAACVRNITMWHALGDIREALNVLSKWKSGTSEETPCNEDQITLLVNSVRTA